MFNRTTVVWGSSNFFGSRGSIAGICLSRSASCQDVRFRRHRLPMIWPAMAPKIQTGINHFDVPSVTRIKIISGIEAWIQKSQRKENWGQFARMYPIGIFAKNAVKDKIK